MEVTLKPLGNILLKPVLLLEIYTKMMLGVNHMLSLHATIIQLDNMFHAHN